MTAPAGPAIGAQSALQAAALFLGEGATPEWMRSQAAGSSVPGALADVADAMDLLLAGGFDTEAFRAALAAGYWPAWAAPAPGGAA